VTLIKPFAALRPEIKFAEDVVAPPYDVLSSEEARTKVVGKPYSFLHISKPEIDLPEGTDPFDAKVYQTGANNLKKLMDANILLRDAHDHYYVYRLIMNGHSQTGIVAVASVSAYDSNRIRKHEFTRPEKEDDRVKQIDALNAQTGPVFLTYRQDNKVDKIIEEICSTEPLYDLVADDGVQHTIWSTELAQQIDSITSLFNQMDCLYIADGHHRSAAASRVAAERGNKTSAQDMSDYFLSVIFPDNQMNILDYNRVVKDLNGLSVDDILSRVSESFIVSKANSAVKPDEAMEFGMYLDGQWYQLKTRTECIPDNDPVARLDVSLLQNLLIKPILGISDPRRDKRIDFVGGIRGLGELEKRVNNGDMAIAFSLYPTSMQALMSVADANEVMPPKSTWFEPKLADGLISHVLD
jgi:uncharacterized protein (DUF1015 family)